ncbi:MAG: hypothetical protein GVY12_00585 [Bacteroidetes bacterium]|nr:hypothetical protein [Bacteroidota bacterium]
MPRSSAFLDGVGREAASLIDHRVERCQRTGFGDNRFVDELIEHPEDPVDDLAFGLSSSAQRSIACDNDAVVNVGDDENGQISRGGIRYWPFSSKMRFNSCPESVRTSRPRSTRSVRSTVKTSL